MPPFIRSQTAALTQLSPSVYLSKPSDNNNATTVRTPPSANIQQVGLTSSSSTDPQLIVLITWMSAHPLHISKYIVGYQTHYPTSHILLIRSSPPDLFYRPTSTQRRRVAPAVSTIMSSCIDKNNTDPKILLHIFSNGGSHQTRNLFRAYSETTSCPFPPHVTILDSCPGRGTFKRCVLALSSALPSSLPLRLLLLLLIYIIISGCWIIFIPFGIADPIERIRQALNDPVLMKGETSRCYIYSEADPMVSWHDVEAHARDAVKGGFVVRKEKFRESGHCAHIRVAGGSRYWAIVSEMWQSRRAVCRSQ